jgi:AmmeMemoRadiSam system protein B
MTSTSRIRRPAVAGLFYPADPVQLRLEIEGYLSEVAPAPAEPKAIIVPHAGYRYSGPVAATGYAQLASLRGRITRVVLLGPTHYVRFRGLAASSADAYATPLGLVPLDKPALAQALECPAVQVLDAAHLREHSLEVHLPFLQVVLGAFQLVPLVVGQAEADETAEVLERLWGGPETLIVVSSDLSHYHDSAAARRLDAETCRLIESRCGEQLTEQSACGCRAIRGLLAIAARRSLPVTTLDLRNSGDTAGGRDRVVGYGAWLVG